MSDSFSCESHVHNRTLTFTCCLLLSGETCPRLKLGAKFSEEEALIADYRNSWSNSVSVWEQWELLTFKLFLLSPSCSFNLLRVFISRPASANWSLLPLSQSFMNTHALHPTQRTIQICLKWQKLLQNIMNVSLKGELWQQSVLWIMLGNVKKKGVLTSALDAE